MARVTSKLQVTIPKAIAEAHGIRPGTELQFESADDVIRIRTTAPAQARDKATRIRSFDEATRRQAARDRKFRRAHPGVVAAAQRGWRREDLYDRGLAR